MVGQVRCVQIREHDTAGLARIGGSQYPFGCPGGQCALDLSDKAGLPKIEVFAVAQSGLLK